MEHYNVTTTTTTTVNNDVQQQQQQQEQQKQQQQQEQQKQLQKNQQEQQHNEQQQQQQQQQFCLRWHNHQTSLLSTLPILLDQCQLTDVTISAEGRTLRAHRVVLSACSTFFLEIFRSLDANNHPIIIIPGASFAAIVSLLTFMYSGEVNVYEEQIPILLSLAETLGIKGLTDVHNNDNKTDSSSLWQKSDIKQELNDTLLSPDNAYIYDKLKATTTATTTATATTPQPLPPPSPMDTATSPFQSILNHKLSTPTSSPLENFFLKSLQFYPNLLPQPLNFSQMALSKTNELINKYQQQCHLYTSGSLTIPSTTPKDMTALMHAENFRIKTEADDDEFKGFNKRFCSGDKKFNKEQALQQQQQQQNNLKRIDKIVESLRETTNQSMARIDNNKNNSTVSGTTTHLRNTPTTAVTSLSNTGLLTNAAPNQLNAMTIKGTSGLISYNSSLSLNEMKAKNDGGGMLGVKESRESISSTQIVAPTSKASSNSKLYATCFICHKQLSNQYNLRVHLETHQNVRYACNVCPHVSRSKDALRKHVSYRHPGVPSPCETEARRRRSTKVLTTIKAGSVLPPSNSSQCSLAEGTSTPTSSPSGLLLPMTTQTTGHFPITIPVTAATTESLNAADAIAHLNSAYMFLPQQFHLVAAAAAAAGQHKQHPFLNKDNLNTIDHLNIHINNPLSRTTSTSTSISTPTTEVPVSPSSTFDVSKSLINVNNDPNNGNASTKKMTNTEKVE